MPRPIGLLLACGLLLSSAAHAAPRTTGAVLGVSIQGLAPLSNTGPGGTIDVTGTTVTVPAGIVALAGPLTVPVTGASAVQSLVITKLSNLSATFSLGGVTAQSPAEVCPGGGPALDVACNAGAGIGGAMALTGTVFVHVVPHIVVVPVNLNAARVGQGGVGAGAFVTEAALWSTGVGLVNTGNNVVAGNVATSPLTLVSPTFILALGNLLPVFASLILTNIAVPEAGPSLLLVVAAASGAILAGRPRRRRRTDRSR